MNEQCVAHLNEKIYKEDNDMEGKHLSFWIEDQLYGIPISCVVQIVGRQEITAIPDYPAYTKGVINLRGNIIPVIDARLRFGKAEAEYNDRTCIIVVRIREQSEYFGLIVDGVYEVFNIPNEAVSPPPHLADHDTSMYLTGLARFPCANGQERIVLLLNPVLVFGSDLIPAPN